MAVVDPVHRRTIEIEIGTADGALVVHARLRDERPFYEDPRRRVLHDMAIELTVDRTMTIVGATADMSAFPHVECPLVTAKFADLVGLSVVRGYSRSLRQVFGGVTACAHLYELARAAGSAVVQGSLSSQVKRGRDHVDDPAAIKGALAGTCHIWGADGVGPVKLDLGWRPGDPEYPVPAVEDLAR